MDKLLVFITMMLLSGWCWAWGFLGHQASAKIAWDLFDSNTKAKISKILNRQDFVQVSTWADQARAEQPEWKFTIWYHFEKAPDNYTYLDNLKRQDPSTRRLGGLIEALYVAEDTLKNPKASDFDKENALKFMIHFIADIHQPLHTGRIEDNSGNKIPVKWLGFDMNLHQIWDSQIILLAHKDKLNIQAPAQQIQAYSDYLKDHFSDLKPTPDMFQRYDDWMHESMVPRADAYKYKDLSEEKYTAMFSDIVDKRVYLAGLRIAYTINRILSDTPRPQPLAELRNQIQAIVGNFLDFVSLTPKTALTN